MILTRDDIAQFEQRYRTAFVNSLAGFTFHDNGEFIRFSLDAYFEKNKNFFKRMFKAKEQIIG